MGLKNILIPVDGALDILGFVRLGVRTKLMQYSLGLCKWCLSTSNLVEKPQVVRGFD